MEEGGRRYESILVYTQACYVGDTNSTEVFTTLHAMSPLIDGVRKRLLSSSLPNLVSAGVAISCTWTVDGHGDGIRVR